MAQFYPETPWPKVGKSYPFSDLDSSASPVLDAGLRRRQTSLSWLGIPAHGFAPIRLVDSGQGGRSNCAPSVEVGLVPLEANAGPKPMQGFKAYQFTLWERLQSIFLGSLV